MATPFLWKLSSQKLGFFLVSFGFIWGMMLLHFTIQQRASHENSAVLRQQILDLSKRYIKALAEENQSVMDGPYVGTMTAYGHTSHFASSRSVGPVSEFRRIQLPPRRALGVVSACIAGLIPSVLWKVIVCSFCFCLLFVIEHYLMLVGTGLCARDLKKTLAVLLDNIMLRLGKLESKVENIYNGTGGNLTNGTSTATPSSTNSEKVNVADLLNGAQEKCELPPLDGFPHCEGKLKWMKEMWRSDSCYSNYGVDGSTCSFFIYLSEVENWCPRLPWRLKTINEEIDRRGQAEIRTSFEELYRVMSQREEFRWMMLRIKRMAEPWVSAIRSLAAKQNLAKRRRKKILVHLGLLTKESGFKIAENAFSGGPLGELVQWSDLITTLYLLGHDVRISASLAELKECMLRVLDSFGTEPEFNHAHYAQSKGHKTPWGKWNLNPQQFNTMFPHTPDNSFLGFVVEQHLNASDIKHIDDIKRQNQSLVYGKVDNFWKDKKKYLDIIHSYMEVHGTVHGTSTVHLPSYVKNHGILSGRDLQFLLRETKLFVGLSFPYEGPAPLEAIANGCAFLNPKFNPPKSSKNTDFFKGKPTLREVRGGQIRGD
eukprot:superscaffoldBa00001632_g11379